MSREDRAGSRPSQPTSRTDASDVLAAISHEMRTPLNSIWGFLEFLAGTELDERQTRWLTLARGATDHLLRLVDGVEGFAHVQMSTSARVGEKVVVNEIVLESVSLVEPIAALREATVHFVNDAEREIVAYGDGDRLRQVLLNLLSNAIKFGPPASTVTVSTRRAGEPRADRGARRGRGHRRCVTRAASSPRSIGWTRASAASTASVWASR